MREDQLSVLVQSMQEKIAVAEKMPAGAERDAVVAEIKAQMGDAQNAGDLYRLEFRSLTHQVRKRGGGGGRRGRKEGGNEGREGRKEGENKGKKGGKNQAR